jgi:dCMP deaminase
MGTPMTVDGAFMILARNESERSKDPTTKVGAVIVDIWGKFISSGHNAFPSGVAEDDRLNDRKLKNEIVVHAEPNAILLADRDLRGATMYVTYPPCCRCAGLIIQAGIKRVVMNPPSPELLERWGESLNLTRNLFAEAGVEYVEFDREYDSGNTNEIRRT